MSTDHINPDHYKQGGLEVIDILRAKLTPEAFEGFLTGNIIKYLLRSGRKHDEPSIRDHQKAAWYANMLAGNDPRTLLTKEQHDKIIANALEINNSSRPMQIAAPLEGSKITYQDASGMIMQVQEFKNGRWANLPFNVL